MMPSPVEITLRCVVSTETVVISKARNRFVAQDVIAHASPPKANQQLMDMGLQVRLPRRGLFALLCIQSVLRRVYHCAAVAEGKPCTYGRQPPWIPLFCKRTATDGQRLCSMDL